MIQGFSVKWPELVSDLLAKKQNGLEYTDLTDYYQLLEEYLDIQFDPQFTNINAIDDYLDPAELNKQNDKDETYDFDLNFDESNAVVADYPLKEQTETPIEKKIDTEVVHGNDYEVETTTVAVLEVKKRDEQESYNVYWWIGIGVALAVIVILIAIIARKRHNHRKQLERQRRENSHA